MRRQWLFRGITALLVSAVLLGHPSLCGPRQVQAANFQFITGIRLAAGENAYEELESQGCRVLPIGLNSGVRETEQVYLGYQLNEGTPITNVLIAKDAGDSFVTEAGIHYTSAGSVDVEQGTGRSGGYVYYTTDERAGKPLVGLDVLRADAREEQELPAIQNDGSEVVRDPNGTPADLEEHSENVTIYLAQIRDGLVRTYIREIEPVTAEDRLHAVFAAAELGYNYFIDGDCDDAASTYTILAYSRTADPAQAVTNLIGVSEQFVELLEEKQIRNDSPEAPEPEQSEPEEASGPEEAPEPEEESEPGEKSEPGEESVLEEERALEEETEPAEEIESEEESESEEVSEPEEPIPADAIDLSGIEYVRVNAEPVSGETPWYLYCTRDPAAGNPIVMLYTGAGPESTQTLFGMWAYGFFSAKGGSRAYSYVINEDLLGELQGDRTVYVKLPVKLITGSWDEAYGITQEMGETLSISLLTKKEGLPEDRLILKGLTERTADVPVLDRTQTEENSYTATAFSGRTIAILAAAGALILACIAGGLWVKKKKETAKDRESGV